MPLLFQTTFLPFLEPNILARLTAFLHVLQPCYAKPLLFRLFNFLNCTNPSSHTLVMPSSAKNTYETKPENANNAYLCHLHLPSTKRQQTHRSKTKLAPKPLQITNAIFSPKPLLTLPPSH